MEPTIYLVFLACFIVCLINRFLTNRFSTRERDPIYCSEDEYLRRMPDDISPQTALTVRRIFSDVSGWDIDEIWPHTSVLDLED